MIGCLDKSRLIAMPTKCGTERLKSTLVKKAKVAIELKHDHGWIQYSGYEQRMLLVRDPMERWVSTYWWLKSTEANQGFKHIVGDCLESFYAFAALVSTQPSNAYVFQPLCKYVDEFEPHRLQPLETILMDWNKVFGRKLKETYVNTAPHKTRDRKSYNDTVKKLPKSFLSYVEMEYDALQIYDNPTKKAAS